MTPVALTRKITFSSGHRYWNHSLSEDENYALFGKWASFYNHGHNYVLDVTTLGNIDPAHGMVVNIKDIDDILKAHVIAKFDQKSINDQVPEFATVAPSVENLLLYFAERLTPVMPPEATLTGLTLYETPLLYGSWKADSKMITLTRVYEFAAAHRLHADGLPDAENLRLFGKCNHVHGHGHNYILEVTIGGEPDPKSGMLASIEDLDRVVHQRVVDRYDHRNLNLDVEELAGLNTTSEVVAKAIFDQLSGHVPAKLVSVRLHETARNIFEVTA
jgi:6-pyruvoyltetrahydropterin/6-carboxytetrahydropterin synthase